MNLAGMRKSGILLAWLAIGSSAWAEQPADMKPATDKLAASIYGGPSMATLRELSDGIGGRLTGSPAYVHATEWAAAKFRSYGIENVRLEPFTLDAGWQRGTATGAMLSPLARPLYVASLGWAPSTPAGGVEGTVVSIADVSQEALEARTDELKGKIVLLDTAKIYADGYGKAMPKVRAAWAAFEKAGVLAVMTSGSRAQQRDQRARWHVGIEAGAFARCRAWHGGCEADPARVGAWSGDGAFDG